MLSNIHFEDYSEKGLYDNITKEGSKYYICKVCAKEFQAKRTVMKSVLNSHKTSGRHTKAMRELLANTIQPALNGIHGVVKQRDTMFGRVCSKLYDLNFVKGIARIIAGYVTRVKVFRKESRNKIQVAIWETIRFDNAVYTFKIGALGTKIPYAVIKRNADKSLYAVNIRRHTREIAFFIHRYGIAAKPYREVGILTHMDITHKLFKHTHMNKTSNAVHVYEDAILEELEELVYMYLMRMRDMLEVYEQYPDYQVLQLIEKENMVSL